LGGTQLIPELVEKFQVSQIFLAIPSASTEQINRIVDICLPLGIELKTLPKVNDILSGRIEVSLLRNIQIEDLLGREEVELSTEKLEYMISNKTVLVTGAGGSIGSELCHQIATHNPSRMILFENCEYFLYEIEMDLKAMFPNVEFVPVIGNVRNIQRVETIFEAYQPNLVFHAAAYKHVPMMEKNPHEAIQTNVFGTKNVVETAAKFNVEKFVLISTDKAVNPTNVMGATKRIAEMVCENISQTDTTTEIIVVRFGNVLGSNGSVIPLFKKQIENGGPITVTHPDITRYFMSIPEASRLVLQSASMGAGGEVFVLDMGESVKIVDLVDRMISLAGLRKGIDIEVEFTGLRVGEKMFEELFSDKEELIKTDHRKVFKAKTRKTEGNFATGLEQLQKNEKDIHFVLKTLVPEYTQLN
jgi:FlaA1/EpsC-like NDP-sugar epimerase